MGGTNHSGILPGGKCSWHRFDDSKKGDWSQKMLKRMVHDRNPVLLKMENKYLAREIVENLGSCELPKLYHWSSDKKVTIDWDSLPDRCVIKTNHWSGGSLFIMDNGEQPLADVVRKFKLRSLGSHEYLVIRNGWDQHGKPWPRWRIQWALARNLKKDFPIPLEWGAYNIKPRGVMIEQLLVDDDDALPCDWKFHCFEGKVGVIQQDTGRMSDHRQYFFTPDGQRINQTNPRFSDEGSPDSIFEILKKDLFKKMIEIANNLSSEIDYTRVDLFLCGDEVYFGEYTNYHQSGHPHSVEWEAIAGPLWKNWG